MKGVSSIIAVILILLIALSITIMGFISLSSLSAQTQVSESNTINQNLVNQLAQLSIESSSLGTSISATIKNVGKANLTNFSAYLNDISVQIQAPNGNLAPGQEEIVTVLNTSAILGKATLKIGTQQGAIALQDVSCASSCAGKICGDDGCRGSCGSCTSPQACNLVGQCIIYPMYSSASTNNSIAGRQTLFSLNWTAGSYPLSFYVFSTNNSGIWQNTSSPFSGTWSNVTLLLNSTVGVNVQWKVYANDTSNNWNASQTNNLITTSACQQYITWSSGSTYTMSSNNTYYCLNQNWYLPSASPAVNITGFNDTLDCQGNAITGTTSNNGIYTSLASPQNTNDTIENCNLTQWNNGFNTYNTNNISFINNTISFSGSNGFLIDTAINNTLINNTVNNCGNLGAYLSKLSNSKITNNTFKNNFAGSIYIASGSNDILINNTAYNTSVGYGIYFWTCTNTSVKGGSMMNNTLDYQTLGGSTNNFTNTNFTTTRTISFVQAADTWFNYFNDTSSLELSTNTSGSHTLTRTINNWSLSNMSWNESANSATAANYNLSSLLPSTAYTVFNNSVKRYTLATDVNGNLPSFTISISTASQMLQVNSSP